jgi:hypothetical protein
MSTTPYSEKPVGIRIRDAELPRISPEPGLSVFVVFTSIKWTLKALEKAREIARPQGADVQVVAVQVVPYPLPLDEPHVPFEFVARRLEEEAGEFPEKTRISAYLCRNPSRAGYDVILVNQE